MSKSYNQQSNSESFSSGKVSDGSIFISRPGKQKKIQHSKKKRIVRKKYKPRKKDIFIHTICILNKNNFKPENSIVESFLISDGEHTVQKQTQDVTVTIHKKDTEYLKKLLESIKFSRTLQQGRPTQRQSRKCQLGGDNNLIHKSTNQRQEYQENWTIKSPHALSQPFLSPYMSLIHNLNMLG